MTEDRRFEIELANELINLANDKQAAGNHPTVIAAAFRHAAANFTAYAYAHGTNDPLATESIMGDFRQALEFYDERHRGDTPSKTSLERIIEQAKRE